ncbi:hypothetical protein [Myxosarcina sp. GI1]|uniref:hypothetical protein n=1 Tax=Myxosarcina sp. GI1 TaxID=1541065 RepID=UPI00055DA295|nr:hypothetical protein [Myxosarcina sp. GI1]
MNDWQAVIGIVAGIISIFGFVPYLTAIYQGKTQPNRTTWWIWTIVGFILLASYYSSGATSTIWVPACLAIGHFIIAILALSYGEKGWNNFDRICLLGAGMSLFLWWWYQTPLIALSLNIAIDFLGALPTIRKSYYKPKSEDPLPWLVFLLAHTVNLFALKSWSFELVAYPLYLFCIVSVIVLLLLRFQIKSILGLNLAGKKYKNR